MKSPFFKNLDYLLSLLPSFKKWGISTKKKKQKKKLKNAEYKQQLILNPQHHRNILLIHHNLNHHIFPPKTLIIKEQCSSLKISGMSEISLFTYFSKMEVCFFLYDCEIENFIWNQSDMLQGTAFIYRYNFIVNIFL